MVVAVVVAVAAVAVVRGGLGRGGGCPSTALAVCAGHPITSGTNRQVTFNYAGRLCRSIAPVGYAV